MGNILYSLSLQHNRREIINPSNIIFYLIEITTKAAKYRYIRRSNEESEESVTHSNIQHPSALFASQVEHRLVDYSRLAFIISATAVHQQVLRPSLEFDFNCSNGNALRNSTLARATVAPIKPRPATAPPPPVFSQPNAFNRHSPNTNTYFHISISHTVNLPTFLPCLLLSFLLSCQLMRCLANISIQM